MDDVVPLQPKVCKKCTETKMKMDFSPKSAECKACVNKKNKKRYRNTNSEKFSWGTSLWFSSKRNVDRL